MHPDLHRYLDGELTRDELTPQQRSAVDVWDTLLAEAAELRDGHAPPWLEARVMGALPPEPELPFWRKAWRWTLEPKSVRVRPVVALVGAAAALVLMVRPSAPPSTVPVATPVATGQPVAATTRDSGPTVYVQFVFAGGDARSVELAGDFNGWNPERHVLRDPDGDGVWTGMFAVPPGLHKYMFLVNGEHWVTDPRAERHIDDGFGMRNALINVSAPAGRAS